MWRKSADSGDRFLFLGDGMSVHRQKLQTLLGDAATFAQPHQAFLRRRRWRTLRRWRRKRLIT